MKRYAFAALSAFLCLALLAGCGAKQPAEDPAPPVSSVSDGGGVVPDAPEQPEEPPALELPEGPPVPEEPTVSNDDFYSFVHSLAPEREWFYENVIGPFDGVLGCLYTKNKRTNEITLIYAGQVDILVTDGADLYFTTEDLRIMHSDRLGTSVVQLYAATAPVIDMKSVDGKLCFIEGNCIVCYDLSSGISTAVPGSDGAGWLYPKGNGQIGWTNVKDETYVYSFFTGEVEQIEYLALFEDEFIGAIP